MADLLAELNLEAGYDFHPLTSSFHINGRELSCELIWESIVNPNFTYALCTGTVRTSSPRPNEESHTTLEAEVSVPLLPPLPPSQQVPQTQPSSSQQSLFPTSSPSSTVSPQATSDPVPSSTQSGSSSLASAQSPSSSAVKPTVGAYICQVPGCGIAHKKPWNHLYQGKRHQSLSPDEKKEYLEVTRLMGQSIPASMGIKLQTPAGMFYITAACKQYLICCFP